MSWSVSACGPAAKAAEQLDKQFTNFSNFDKGEMETIQNTRTLVAQTLATIDPERPIRITASGSMGFKDYTAKTGPYQSVDLKIEPIHFTTT